MGTYDAFDIRMSRKPSNTRERHIYDFHKRSSRLIKANPSYKSNLYIDGEPRDVVIKSTNFPNEKEIRAVGSERAFNLGELVIYQDAHWLIVEEDLDDDVTLKGRMKQCKYLLRWQNPNTLEIIERWTVVENPYSRGLDENSRVSLGGNQFKILMQYDDETRLIHIDKRFLIGTANNKPMVYKIIRFDDITDTVEDNSKGFITVVLEQDELRPSDNQDLMIADYISPSPISEVIGICDIVFKGSPVLKVSGFSKTFDAIFYNTENEAVDIQPVWELILPAELDDRIRTVYDNNSITLKALPNAVIGSKFILKLSAEDAEFGIYEKAIEITVEGLI